MIAQQDWTGNKPAIFACHGASNHSERDRAELDYYATDPKVVEMLLCKERFHANIWEPAVGGGHIAEVLEKNGHVCFCSDIVDRGYPCTYEIDFLTEKFDRPWDGDIITNPPYKYAKEFVLKAMDVLKDGYKLAMFLKLTFLESKKRKELFDKYPPKKIYVMRDRYDCALNGDFSGKAGKAVCYAWFVWEKGYCGLPEIDWLDGEIDG